LSFPANVIPVFGSQRPYVDLNFALGSFGVNGGSVSSLALLSGFTFTRASLAMGYDATGKLTYGPNNLLLQSQTFGTTWSQVGVTVTSDAIAAPDGTLTADKIMEVAAASTPRISQVCTGLVGSVNVFSVYAKTAERNQIRLVLEGSGLFSAYFNTDTGVVSGTGGSCTATMTSVGNGWYRCSVTWTAATTAFAPYIATASGGSTIGSGDNTKGIYLWGAQLEAVTYQTTPSTYYPTTSAAYYGPRLVYDPVTLASLGILVEEARTNLLLQSQAFDNASWTKDDTTVTVNAVTSPDGTANADKLVEAATTANHRVRQAVTISNTTVYTYSVYVKAAERTWAFFEVISGATDLYCYVNLSTGALGTTNTTPTVTSVGNGWYRVAITFTSAAVSVTCYNQTSTGNGTTSYLGDGTSGLYIWQAQLELGQGASSPIPTTTAAVTRAADVARLTGLTLAYPLTLAAGFIKNFGATTSRAVTLQIDGNNFSTMGLNSALATRLDVAQGGSFQAQITGATPGLGVAVLGAGRIATNDVGFAAQGALVGTDVSATMPSAPTAANIGMFSDGGSEPLNGTISRIRIFLRGLPDTSLQSLTS
jgi:hypothetical protein